MDPLKPVANPLAASPDTALTPGSANPSSGGGFLDMLKESIRKVNEAQVNADQAITNYETGKGEALHQTMIALQKADLSFELMMAVRNKILTAYDEISKMQM